MEDECLPASCNLISQILHRVICLLYQCRSMCSFDCYIYINLFDNNFFINIKLSIKHVKRKSLMWGGHIIWYVEHWILSGGGKDFSREMHYSPNPIQPPLNSWVFLFSLAFFSCAVFKFCLRCECNGGGML